MSGHPCVWVVCRLAATHLAEASQGWLACVSWSSAQHHPGLLPSWQAHRGQALIVQQGAEYGFGLLSGQIKTVAEAWGAVWAYK